MFSYVNYLNFTRSVLQTLIKFKFHTKAMSMNYDASPFARNNGAGAVNHDSFQKYKPQHFDQSSARLENRLPVHQKDCNADPIMSAKLKSSPNLMKSSSAGLQTNPTFVSVHNADAEDMEHQLESQYLREQGVSQDDADDNISVMKSATSQSIFVWGSNNSGQLGLKSNNFGRFDIPLSLEFHQKIQSVSCGEQHTAMVTFSRQLYVMGSNSHAQLGLGDPKELQRCTVPTLVQSMAHLQVLSVHCGANHTLSIAREIIGEQDSMVYAWGDNSKGQTGTGVSDELVLNPHRLEFKTADDQTVKIDSVSAGKEHTFFLDTTQWRIFACGESRQGQLGIDYSNEVVHTPIPVPSLASEQIVDVSCGDNHTIALNYVGNVLAAGSNITGQLGLGHTQSMHCFEKIPGLQNILHVGASTHSCAVDSEGRLYRWGQGVKGVYLAPLKIASPRPIFIDQVSMGSDFGIVKNKKGEIFTYGVNQSGQLGLGDQESRSSINSLVSLNQHGTIRRMAAGSNFVVCLVDMRNTEDSGVQDPNKVPVSAPVLKQGQLRDGGDRTSVTEFKEYGHSNNDLAIMSEKRQIDSTVHDHVENGLMQKMLSQQGIRGTKDLVVDQTNTNLSDVGTITTMQTAQMKRAIQHELSQDTRLGFDSERQCEPIPSTREFIEQQAKEDEVTRSEVLMNEDVMPPYTRSPFNGQDRRINYSNPVSAGQQLTKNSNSNRFDIQSYYPNDRSRQDIRDAPEYRENKNNIAILEQLTLAERLELKSDFAKGRSRSSERNLLSDHHNHAGTNVASSVAYDNMIISESSVGIFQSKNQYAGLEQTKDSQQIKYLHQQQIQEQKPQQEQQQQQQISMPLRRSHSPNKQSHVQAPSFSVQEPNQFRNRSRHIVPEVNQVRPARQQHQSLQHTGQFTQLNTENLNRLRQQRHVNRSQESQMSGVNVLRGEDFTVHEMSSQVHQISSGIQDPSTSRQMLTTMDKFELEQNVHGLPQPPYQPYRSRPQCGEEERAIGSSRVLSGNTSEQHYMPMMSSRERHGAQENKQFLKTQNARVSNDRMVHHPHQNQRQQTDHSNNSLYRAHKRQATAFHEQQNPHPQLHKQSQPRSQKYKRMTKSHSRRHNQNPQLRVKNRYAGVVDQSSQLLSPAESSILQQPLLTTSTIQTYEETSNTPVDSRRENRHHYHQQQHQQRQQIHKSTSNQKYKTQQQATRTFSQRQAPIGCNNCGYHVPQEMPSQREPLLSAVCSCQQLEVNSKIVSQSRQLVKEARDKTLSRSRSRHRDGQHYLNCSNNLATQQSFKAMSKPQPQPHQLLPIQEPVHNSDIEKRLRKKYKRMKMEASRVQLEQHGETEKLKLRIHELQSMIQQRDTAQRSTNIQKSEGYQALVNRYTTEASDLQEKVCTLERTLVAKEAQIGAFNRERCELKEQVGTFSTDLRQVCCENEILKQEAAKMIEDIEKLARNHRDQDHQISHLREQLESKTRLCADSESSLSHLSKTLDDLTKNFEGAKKNAEQVMSENDKLRADMRINSANVLVYENQVKNLKSFIDELESNNKGLVRHLDQKNMVQADEYRSKVSTALSQHQQNHRQAAQLDRRHAVNAPFPHYLNATEIQSSSTQPQLFFPSKSHSPVTKQQRYQYNSHVHFQEASRAPSNELISYRQTENKHHQAIDSNQMTMQARPLSPQELGSHLVAQSHDGTNSQLYQTQQHHCVRIKSREPETAVLSPSAQVSQSMPLTVNKVPSAATVTIAQDNQPHEQLDARQSMQNVLQQINRARSSTADEPTKQFLVERSNQLIDQVQRHHDKVRTNPVHLDPRSRLNGRTPTRNNHSRSVSPVDFVKTKQQHNTSHVYRRSISRSISANAHSTVSHGSNDMKKLASGSQESLHIQYQQHTESVKQPQQELPPAQRMLQWKLPDIRNVLASSPGKSRMAHRERTKSPMMPDQTPAVDEILTASGSAQNIRKVETIKQQAEPISMPSYPKLTGTMLRAQLHNMNESLAQMKRARIQQEGSVQNSQ